MKQAIWAWACMAALAVSAEMKIATVDMVRLVRMHPSHETNRTLIKTTDKDYKTKLEARQEAIKTLADEGKKAQDDLQNPMLSPAAKADAQKKLEDVQRRFLVAQQDLRTAAQHFQNELADLETRLLKLETEDVRAKIAAFAKDKGFDLIVDQAALGYAKEALDVTDAVLASMGVESKKATAGEKK